MPGLDEATQDALRNTRPNDPGDERDSGPSRVPELNLGPPSLLKLASPPKAACLSKPPRPPKGLSHPRRVCLLLASWGVNRNSTKSGAYFAPDPQPVEL